MRCTRRAASSHWSSNRVGVGVRVVVSVGVRGRVMVRVRVRGRLQPLQQQ